MRDRAREIRRERPGRAMGGCKGLGQAFGLGSGISESQREVKLLRWD